MVQSDLVVREGTVIDGTGAPGRDADIEVRDGRIVAIGRSVGPADVGVDAEGHTVTPGFTQTAEGILATIVEGTIVLRDGVHTGALPGRLLRNTA